MYVCRCSEPGSLDLKKSIDLKKFLQEPSIMYLMSTNCGNGISKYISGSQNKFGHNRWQRPRLFVAQTSPTSFYF